MATERVRYLKNVSRQERKIDNVCNSRIVWNGIGAVMPVPESVAVKLLQYPTVWQEVVPGQNAPVVTTAPQGQPSLMGDVGIIPGQGGSQGGSGGAPPTPNPAPATDLEKVEKAVEAIGRLDPLNPEHFTNQGIPRVDAIGKLLGYDITAEQRDAAWAAVQAQKQPLPAT